MYEVHRAMTQSKGEYSKKFIIIACISSYFILEFFPICTDRAKLLNSLVISCYFIIPTLRDYTHKHLLMNIATSREANSKIRKHKV